MEKIEVSRLFVLDWDGVGNSKKGGPLVPWNVEALPLLVRAISDVRAKTPQWGFVLDTGRNSEYGLAVAELLGLGENNPGLWSGFEGGLVLCQHTTPWRPVYHPSLVTEEYVRAIKSLEGILLPKVLELGGAKEYKELYLTLNPPLGMPIESFYDWIQDQVQNRTELEYVSCEHSGSAVDFAPHQGAKEDTIEELAARNGVALGDICYFGDGGTDIAVGQKVGTFGSPNNAPDRVKEAADLIATLDAPRGTVDLIRRIALGKKDGIVGLE